MRRSKEPLSQKALAYELRMRIDRARAADGTSHGARFRPDVFGRACQTRAAVLTLIEEHPVGAHASHVRHNLGPVRREWLDELLARGRAPCQSQPAARSSAKEESVVRDNPDLKKQVEPDPKRQDPTIVRGDAEPTKKGKR